MCRLEVLSAAALDVAESSKQRPAMLVLSRKKNESLVINDNIVVTVVQIFGDKVRLGIEAPKEVTVHRREVYDKLKQSREAEKSPPETAE